MKNPVAKFMNKFNKSSIERNKKKEYNRKLKHRKKMEF